MGVKIFYNARCGGPDRFGIWELRTDQLQSKPLPQNWSCWQPSTGGLRYAKTDFVTPPYDYLGDTSIAHPTGDFHHVSMAFDSIGWPMFATNIGTTGVRVDQHISETLTEEYQWQGTNAVLFNNYLIEPDVNNTDVVVYYTKTGIDRNIYARFSRENYIEEYSLLEFPIKIEELIKAEVESGHFQVLYGRTDHNREIKIYFSEYPEFPYFGNASETNTGTYGFYTGQHRRVVIESTGYNLTGNQLMDTGFNAISFESGFYYSAIQSGSGWLMESGIYDSGSQVITFESGQYYETVFSGGGRNADTGQSGTNVITFETGQYYEAVGRGSGVDESSGTNSISFESGQYFLGS